MAKVDETQQGVHPFTLDWWQGLPEAYRTADRAQGYHITEAWAGYNADPRFITGWDSWDRTNTSTEPWVSSLGLTRRFRVEPGAPVLIRTWHNPTFNTHDPATTAIVGDAVVGDMILGLSPGELTVGHRVRNHTGTVVAETVQTLTGEGYVDTWVTPDRFGTLHVSINVAIPVPDSSNLIRAVHVGTNEPAFDDLPDITDFTVARAYPLLRFMDGIGYQGGHLRDTAEQMHDGAWTNPYEAPTIALPYLAAVLGLPTEYVETLTGDQLRAHLVGMVESGLPATGSRPAIEAVAKQWLTGDRQVAIIPAHTLPEYDAQPPAVRLHTLVLLVRADEVPNGDMPAFQRFLNNSGVVPAGHALIATEASQDWGTWQQAVGDTWATMQERAPRWVDHRSIGIEL